MAKEISTSGHDINSEAYRIAMLNANRADKEFVPLLVSNDKSVKEYLYLKKLDEEWKRKPK